MTRTAAPAGHGSGIRMDRVNHTLLPLWRRIYTEFTRRMEWSGLTPNAAFVLLELFVHPDRAEPSVLAESTCLPRQTMTFVIDQLEHKALLRRTPHPSDRRRRILQITPRGHRLARRIWDDVVRFESRGLAAVPPVQVSKIRIQLNHYADALARQNAVKD